LADPLRAAKRRHFNQHQPYTHPNMAEISIQDLEAYLDEALPAEDMARIEKALCTDAALLRACLKRGCLRQVAWHGRRRLSIRWIMLM